MRIALLAVTAAAFLLVPAASAFAGTGNVNERKATVEIMGAGSGTIKSSPGPLEGNPPLECHWNGSEIDVGQTYTKVGGPSEANTKEVVAGECNTEAGEGAGFPGLKVEYIADAGSEFAYPPGWELVGANSLGGSCEPYIAFCAPASVAGIDFTIKATFGIRYPLTVKKTGSGDGTVKSKRSTNSVECAPGCTEATEEFAATTLTETPDSESEFTGWTGCSEEKVEAGKVNCIVSLGGAAEVEANFTEIPKFNLAVAKTGEGSGTVTSSPAGINCGTECDHEFQDGTPVTLTAAEDTGSTFTGWTGSGCSGTGTCEVTMDEAHSVEANFDLVPETLTVTAAGGGSGTLECEDNAGSCSGTALYGHTIKITATPDAENVVEKIETTGSANGECSVGSEGESGSCEFEITEGSSVTVYFESAGTKDQAEGNVHGEVPVTTSLESACSDVDLGKFLPGVNANYIGNCGVTVTSTGVETELRASDESAVDTGHLIQDYTDKNSVKHHYALLDALQTKVGAGTYESLDPGPVSLVTYGTPVSNKNETVWFRQHIGATEGLHTGTYAKTITLTLEQTTP